MAIKNPFASKAKTGSMPTADSAPDWHKHPDILAHRSRLESARDNLPILARTLEHMEQKYRDAEEVYARCEMLSAAGKPLPEGYATLEDAHKALEQAKTAYLVARVAHADAAREHGDLEANAQANEEQARSEVARQMSDEFMVLLDAQKATLEAAIEAQDAVQQYLHKIHEAFPGYVAADYAFDTKLGLGIWPINDLRKPTPMQPNGILSGWFTRYEQIKATRQNYVKPIDPEKR
jgi:hypothetical protein